MFLLSMRAASIQAKCKPDMPRRWTLLVRAGQIRAWVPEVSIPLPPPYTKERMRLDVMIIENDGRIRWQDVKGMEPDDGVEAQAHGGRERLRHRDRTL